MDGSFGLGHQLKIGYDMSVKPLTDDQKKSALSVIKKSAPDDHHEISSMLGLTEESDDKASV